MKITRRKLLSQGPIAAAAALATGGPRTEAASTPPSGSDWPRRRQEVKRLWLDLLGDFPREIPPLRPEIKKVAEENGIERFHVSFQSEPDDRVTGWLLVPPGARRQPAPGIICMHSTTWGTAKDSTIGRAGMFPGLPPEHWTTAYRNPEVGQAFGRDLARHGFVTLSIDLLTDGERIKPEGRPSDSRWFYQTHPEWSMTGKAIWDVMRSVDLLQSLDFVQGDQIGCTGWSIGGHYTLFAAAFDDRIKAAVPNGGVLDWHQQTSDAWSRKPESWKPWVKGDPVPKNEEFQRRFGQAPNAGPYVYIKRFRPYIDDRTKVPPVDFDSLMMMVAPRALLILSSEWEYYSHKILPKCLKAMEVYMNWRDDSGLPGVVAARQSRRGYDRTVDYYQFHNLIPPEKMPEQLRTLNAGDCFSWFSFPGGHSTPPAAREVMFGWFDRWLGHVPPHASG